MADDSEMKVRVHADVPSNALATVTSREQARFLARRIGGEQPRNECTFSCLQCGWNGSIAFTAAEMEELENNPEEYDGPCPGFARQDRSTDVILVPGDTERTQQEFEQEYGVSILTSAVKQLGSFLTTSMEPKRCGLMMLRPTRLVAAGHETSISERATQNRRKELREAAEMNAEVFIEKVPQIVTSLMQPAVRPGPEPAAVETPSEPEQK